MFPDNGSANDTIVDKHKPIGYARKMIKSFKHKGLEDFFYTGNKKGIKPDQEACGNGVEPMAESEAVSASSTPSAVR